MACQTRKLGTVSKQHSSTQCRLMITLGSSGLWAQRGEQTSGETFAIWEAVLRAYIGHSNERIRSIIGIVDGVRGSLGERPGCNASAG